MRMRLWHSNSIILNRYFDIIFISVKVTHIHLCYRNVDPVNLLCIFNNMNKHNTF